MIRCLKLLIVLLVYVGVSCQQPEPPQPYGAIPTKAQVAWHEMEYFSLICYGLNTYTEEEWAFGDVDPKLFNPSGLDTDQWAKVTSEAGMKGLILVAKHHDGFCLWPSKYTNYSVKATPWKNGQGDVLGDLAKSCQKYGLKLGVYLSPWDRNHADYGKPEYVDYYYKQMEELLTQYGDIFEFWIDGANGGTGYYGGANERREIDRKNYYGFDKIFSIVEKHQPEALIFSDVGPGVRWVGNEQGIAGLTNWNVINTHGKVPGETSPEFHKKLSTGEEGGAKWIPAEANTTLLWPKAWYFHTGHQPRTLSNLMDLYYTSIGRGATLDLGIAIAPTGKIRDIDAQALLKFKKQLDREFKENIISKATLTASDARGNSKHFAIEKCQDQDRKTYWATNDEVHEATIDIRFDKAQNFNRLVLQEYIELGQRISGFSFEVERDGKFVEVVNGTTVGYKRALRFERVETSRARLILTTKAPCLTLSEIGMYDAPVLVDDPVITVDLKGWVSFKKAAGSDIYYSLGEKPSETDYKLYSEPIELKEGGRIHYFAKEINGDYSTDVIKKEIGIARNKWNVISPKGMQQAIDNNPKSFAISKSNEIVINLGEEKAISGFSYLPRQDGEKEGIIFEYEFYCSKNGKQWGQAVASGTFSNIENNPIAREIKFEKEVSGKFIKLVAKSDIRQSGIASFAEIQIFTNN